MTRQVLIALVLFLGAGLGLTVWMLSGSSGAPVEGRPLGSEGGERGPEPSSALPELAALAHRANRSGAAWESTRASVEHPPGNAHQVVVQDEAGAPIEGAEVLPMGYRGPDEEQQEQPLVGEPVLTDAEGRCSFEAPGAEALFHVRAEGFAHKHGKSVPPKETLVFMAREVTVSGRVLEAGTLLPVSGAVVRPFEAACPFCEPRSTTTDALGGFSVHGFGVGRESGLRASAVGYLSSKHPFELRDERAGELRGEGASRIDLTLERGALLWLEFFDLDTGEALPGVVVEGAKRRRSDGEGRLRTRDLLSSDQVAGEGAEQLDLRREGFARMKWTPDSESLNPSAPVRIPMARVRPFEVSASDPAGAPLAGVRVKVTDTTDDAAETLWRRRHKAAFAAVPGRLKLSESVSTSHSTGSDGEAQLAGLAPWTQAIEVRVTADGFEELTGTRVLDPADTPFRMHWTLVPHAELLGNLRGRLTLNGEPTAGRVDWIRGADRVAAYANEAGAFELAEVPAGPGTLIPVVLGPASRPECLAPLSGSWPVEVRGGETSVVDLEVQLELATISGTVRYSDGAPAASQPVVAEALIACSVAGASKGGRWPLKMSSAFSDETGAWSFEVPADTEDWTVSTEVLFETVAREHLAPGASGVELVIERPSTQRLRVFDSASGLPLARFDLRWQRRGARTHERIPRDRMGLPDAEGWFEVPMPEGPFDLAVSARKSRPGSQPAFAFGHDTRLGQPLEFTIEAGHGIELKLARKQQPWPKDVEVFLLAHDERGAVRWPDPGGKTVDGDLSTGHPARSTRRVRFSSRRAALSGLPAGSYEFVSFPDVLEIDPPRVRASASEKPIEVRWKRL